MPKMKTHRGAAKRFKITGSGKVKRYRANKSHILRRPSLVATRGEVKHVKRLLLA